MSKLFDQDKKRLAIDPRLQPPQNPIWGSFAFFLAGLGVFHAASLAQADTKVLELLNRNSASRAAELILEPPVDPDESIETNNPLVDCSTNAAYRSGIYGQHALAHGHNNCAACHRGPRPTMGDRPTVSFASFTLENRFNAPLNYEVKIGEQGKWTQYAIEPNKSQRFAWEYENPKVRASPKYYVRYGGSVFRCVPLATPNIDIGSLYYFSANADGSGARILSCKQQPTRQSNARRW